MNCNNTDFHQVQTQPVSSASHNLTGDEMECFIQLITTVSMLPHTFCPLHWTSHLPPCSQTVPELGALPSYKCTDDRSRKDKIKGKMKKDEDGLIVGTVCEQGGKCEVQWRGQKVCGNIDTVVMSCMKHSISAPVRLCEAEEEGCVCTWWKSVFLQFLLRLGLLLLMCVFTLQLLNFPGKINKLCMWLSY